jgi:hypothetical protein
VWDAGIEVDGISGVELVSIDADSETELAFHDEQEFRPRMLVRPQFIGIDGRELSEVCIGAAIITFVIEAFEVIGSVGHTGTFGKADAFALADNLCSVTPALVGEEIVEADTKDQGNAKQGWKRGVKLVTLELGKQCGGESGVLAEFDEAHAFLEAKGTEFGSDLVGPEIVFDCLVDHDLPP